MLYFAELNFFPTQLTNHRYLGPFLSTQLVLTQGKSTSNSVGDERTYQIVLQSAEYWFCNSDTNTPNDQSNV